MATGVGRFPLGGKAREIPARVFPAPCWASALSISVLSRARVRVSQDAPVSSSYHAALMRQGVAALLPGRTARRTARRPVAITIAGQSRPRIA